MKQAVKQVMRASQKAPLAKNKHVPAVRHARRLRADAMYRMFREHGRHAVFAVYFRVEVK